MAIELNKFENLGTLQYGQVDGNWTELEEEVNNVAEVPDIHNWLGDKTVKTGSVNVALDWVVLPDAATIAVDFDAFINAEVTLTANRTIGNPTNVTSMATRQLLLKGDSATLRTVTFGANFKGEVPVINDLSSTRWYLLVMQPYGEEHIILTSARAL